MLAATVFGYWARKADFVYAKMCSAFRAETNFSQEMAPNLINNNKILLILKPANLLFQDLGRGEVKLTSILKFHK